jgi:hypothetical protein
MKKGGFSMALNKQLINDNGVITNYHRVSHVNLSDNILDCSIQSYVSSEYRELEKYADTSYFSFDITVEEEEAMGIRALCYTKIKEMADWADATDC